MSEWFKELVLKTSDTATYRGFESHPVRHIFYIYRFADLPKWWRGSPAKGVGLETGARVQISQSAPSIKSHKSRNCVACELFYFSPPAFWSLFGHYGFENCISESKRRCKKKRNKARGFPQYGSPRALIYHTAKKNYLILKKGYSKHTGRNTALFADY